MTASTNMLDKSTQGRRLPRGAKPGQRIYPGRGYSRVIDVIELLAAQPSGMTGSEIHRALKLPKSTSFLMLQHLKERGVVAMDPADGKFAVGPALLQIAHQVTGSLSLVRIARPYLEALAQETTEDIYLGVRNGTQLMYVDKVTGTRSVGFDVRLGWPRSLHSTASGKLLLAFSTPELVAQVVEEQGLPALTKATITDIGQLRRALNVIRERGYEVSDGQNVAGVLGLAAPVRNHAAQVVAAVHISTLTARSPAERQALVKAMVNAAAQVSAAFGMK